MSKKRLVLFGTRHWQAHEMPRHVQKAIELIVGAFRPSVALEEWSDPTFGRSSGAELVCNSLLPPVPWRNIGTPWIDKFKSYDHTYALDPPEGEVPRYGPIDVQEAREIAMCDNVRREMEGHDVGLLVIGEAHLHSMYSRLSNEFEVDAYGSSPRS